ncbi:TonB-dependent siderophore receptor [Bergeyella sp. RCAD1439]|uniref:TonB-dependent siderophore receptor n=1 Tax=Bergeyella anatis TaxID=3113737 RepID=UPI002E197881|nr:TonB-dependent receptor [Bergeyella sp. RCAD1439]
MKKTIIGAVLWTAPLGLFGQDKDSVACGHSIIDEVVIEGLSNAKEVSSALVAKLPLKNLENPQVITSVAPQLIENRNFYTQSGMLLNATGVAPSWAGFSPYYSVRGFRTRSSFRNGVNGYVASDADPVNIAQLEVVKGPSAVIFGGGGSTMITFGGAINRITVRPQLKSFSHIGFSAGSYDLQRVTVDFNRSLDKQGAFLTRVTGAYHYKETFQDQGWSGNFFLAPSVLYRINERLTVRFESEILNRTSTNSPLFQVGLGVASRSGELDWDYRRSFTDNSLTMTNKSVNLYGKAIYRLSQNWRSETNLVSVRNRTFGDYIRLRLEDDNRNVTRRVYRMYPEGIYGHQVQQDFIGDFWMGKLRSRLLAGVEFYQYLYAISSKSMNFTKVPLKGDASENALFHNEYLSSQLALKPYSEKYRALQNHYSVYASQVVNLSEHFNLMLSARLNYIDNKGVEDALAGLRSGAFTQTAFSPKLGVNYQVIPQRLAFFANYMNGFQAEAPRSVNGQMTNFRPMYGNQWETGVKAALKKGLLDASVSYYAIEVSSMVRQSPTDAELFIQDGRRYSRGIEADFQSNPFKGWFVHAGIAYNESRFVVSDALTQGLRPVDSGPKFSATWYVRYAPALEGLKGVSLGVGGSHYGKDLILNTAQGMFYTEAYALFNAAIALDRPRFVVSLSAENLLNRHYWYGGRGMVSPGGLRQVVLSFKIKL